jgi:Big-like domain-containing protein
MDFILSLHSNYALHFRLLLIVLVAGVFSCATSVPPDGGPVDSEAPSIIETYPASGATLVRGKKIHFEFSEYVDRSSFQQSLHISPLTERGPEFDWGSTSVTLIFPEEFEEERTYVVTVGTSLKDVNAGNTMASSYTLAFSTGDSLDTGSLRGRVFDDEPAGVSVFAYLLSEINPDTLNPSTEKPDYAIQTDARGTFVLNNLRQGQYRLFAVRDKQKNYLYDIESDAIGIAEYDPSTASSDSGSIALRFRLSVEDTSAPYIQSLRVITSTKMELRFSEQSYPFPLPLSSIHLTDSVSGTEIQLVDIIPVQSPKNSYQLISSAPLTDARYMIAVDSLSDIAGNNSNPEQASSIFSGSTEPDTSRAVIATMYPTPSAEKVLVDSAFSISFSTAMKNSWGVTLEDSSGTTLDINTTWIYPHIIKIEHPVLEYSMRYQVCIDLAVFKDSLSAMTIADSIYCFNINTIESDVYGSISGSVEDAKATGVPLRVVARASANAWTGVVTSEDGKFKFPKVPEGKYRISAYADADSNSSYSYGKAFPYRHSERFGILNDTLRVRARWESKGADIIVP